MSSAGKYLKFPASDLKLVAGIQSAERRRKTPDVLEIGMPLRDHTLGLLRVESVVAVEFSVMLRLQRARVEVNIPADQIFRFAHIDGHVEPLGDPARHPDVIGMEMGDDNSGQRPVETAGEEFFPGRLSLRIPQSGIEQRPAILVVDQVDVDVVETIGKRQSDPKNAWPYLDRDSIWWRGLRIICKAFQNTACYHRATSLSFSSPTYPNV